MLVRSGMRRPRGVLYLRVFKRGLAIGEIVGANLYLNAGLPPLASLLGGDVTGQSCSAFGVGSGSGAPAVGDTALTAPVYFKAFDSHAENGSSPGAGSVQFDFSLDTSATITKTWAATTAFSLDDTIAPGDGYYYKCTTPGTSGGTEPTFNTALASTTSDGSVVWTNQGVYDSGAIGITVTELALFANNTPAVTLPGATAPTPILARKTISPIAFTAGMAISGSWVLTF